MDSTAFSEDSQERDPLDLVAQEFAERCRRGEHPSIETYAEAHPALAEEIRRILPAVAFLERGKGSDPRAIDITALDSGGWGLAADSSRPPKKLGENQIVREIGRGGMGIVYEAVQEPLGRRVAIKVLPRQAHAEPRARQRFLREARVVARLQHPHIVPIHAISEDDGMLYFVMPLIDGAGLDRLPAEPPAKPVAHARWIANLGLQAAEALAYAHGQNVLHRDIKPANLLLDTAGTLYLADFGLAKLADDLTLTGTGELPGTLRYLAPECLHSEANARSDIYSLGLTLYELLIGRPAFPESDRIRLLHQIQVHQIPRPTQLLPAIPRDMETIVLKAMAYDPSHRYASAADLAADLQSFLDGRAIRARPARAPERLLRWGRRNPLVAALSGISLALALIAAYFIRLFVFAPPRHAADDWPPPVEPGAPPGSEAPEDPGFPPPPRGPGQADRDPRIPDQEPDQPGERHANIDRGKRGRPRPALFPQRLRSDVRPPEPPPPPPPRN